MFNYSYMGKICFTIFSIILLVWPMAVMSQWGVNTIDNTEGASKLVLTDLNLENYRQKANYKKKQPRLKLDNLVSDAMV